MNRLKLMLLSICLLMVACNANDSISRENRCQFIFDTTLHPLPCHLTGIIGNNGHFCQVQTYVDNQGIRHLKTTRNYDKAKDDVALTTAREAQFSYYLGANDCIIIGTSKYSIEQKLVAYDGQCPNCLSEYGGYNYPLTWQNNGDHLHCAKCNRTYDVNNGVVADGAAGRELLRYYAALDGGLIRAWN